MPIDQSKLDALKSLASGGTPGLDAYRQAQSAEATSRTDALKGALGGQDVYAATQKAQAQYAPNVGTNPFANAESLNPAANQFLNQGASKLADQAYEANQNLSLQADQLARSQEGKYNKEMLQGAADVYGAKQKENLGAGAGLQDLVGQRQSLKDELGRLDLQVPQGGDSAMVTPEVQAANDARRAAITQQLGAIDEQYKAQAGTYAGALGRDTKGLEEAYASGDANKVTDLLNYLNPETQEATRRVDIEGNKRLQELAPAFGINKLAAAGMFPETDGVAPGLKDAQATAAGEDYVSGKPSAAQTKQVEADQANNLGFGSANDYRKTKNQLKMNDDEITQFMNDPDWNDISNVANAFRVGDESVTQGKTGVKGFQEMVQNMVNTGFDVVDGKNVPWDKTKRSRMQTLANNYYNSLVAKAAGTGSTEAE